MTQARAPLHEAGRERPPPASVVAHDGWCSGHQASLRVRIHRPATPPALPPLALYFHPGRFVSGGLDQAEIAARRLAERLGVAVVSPAYSLATERPFPAAAEDAYAAFVWACEEAERKGWDARRVAVIGDEAGGNLAAVVAMMARDRRGPSIAAQVLIAPMLDPTVTTRSVRATSEVARGYDEAYRRYLPQAADRLHPYAAPALCPRLDGLPPALIVTARDDALHDEAESYAARLDCAGVYARLIRLPEHGASAALWLELATFLGFALVPGV